jgi:thymidylate kinase
MIIGINGWSGSGKDVTGNIIKKYLQHYEIKKFGGKLKEIASILTGIPIENFENQEFKKTNLSSEWNIKKKIKKHYASRVDYFKYEEEMTARTLLQTLGTDCLRNNLHEDVWVNALFSEYKSPKMSEKYPSDWIITDVRFENEIKRIEELGGITIRINRINNSPINAHPSETSLDDWNFKYIIDNNGTLEELEEKILNILKQEKLI